MLHASSERDAGRGRFKAPPQTLARLDHGIERALRNVHISAVASTLFLAQV
jgi:hypothetical protein